jgi:ABC-2 type transport system permease protein
MTFILVRKLLRDVRPALIAVSLVLFLFAVFWVKITQRVTTQIVPMARLLSIPFGDKKTLEKVFVRGPSKVSQAALGWGEMNFDAPTDFLAIGLLHPVVLVMCLVWGVGRASGAVAGELDRGTMELLMSQPVPRSRLLVAHLCVDCVVLPVLCLSFFAGTQFGLWAVGDFVPDYTLLDEGVKDSPQLANGIKLLPRDMTPLQVSGAGEPLGLVNTLAMLFAISGLTLALSSVGRNRWRVVGLAVLILLGMFVANTVGQLWEPMGWARPFTVFYYYQPQRLMIDNAWLVDVGTPLGAGAVRVPAVGVLFAAGAAGYALALRVFTRRDLPAPL